MPDLWERYDVQRVLFVTLQEDSQDCDFNFNVVLFTQA